VKLKEQEEQRWMMSETLLWLRSPTVKVELLQDSVKHRPICFVRLLLDVRLHQPRVASWRPPLTALRA
jgi:hypothetical protein